MPHDEDAVSTATTAHDFRALMECSDSRPPSFEDVLCLRESVVAMEAALHAHVLANMRMANLQCGQAKLSQKPSRLPSHCFIPPFGNEDADEDAPQEHLDKLFDTFLVLSWHLNKEMMYFTQHFAKDNCKGPVCQADAAAPTGPTGTRAKSKK
jgi:hypothetical protein